MKKNQIKLVLILLVFVLTAGIVSADLVPGEKAHNPNIAIYPNIASCADIPSTFIVTVGNDVSSENKIKEVRIYKGTAGIAQFFCGSAPNGWYLYAEVHTEDEDYCEYKSINTSSRISPGNSLDFTFDATIVSEACMSSFTISTLDDAIPVAQHKYSFPTLMIDCTNPIIYKMVGNPRVPIDPECSSPNGDSVNGACNFWVTEKTLISMHATDNNEELCDTGIDYCEYQIVFDGVPQGWSLWNYEGDSFNLYDDSVHEIELRCFDMAGNVAVLSETDKVDNTHPETTKTYGIPRYPDIINDLLLPHWIKSTTPITLTPVDPDPTGYSCNIGVDYTKYRITMVDDSYCADYDSCYSWTPCEYRYYLKGDFVPDENCPECPPWQAYNEPFSINEESCHIIEFKSTDYLGNREPIQWQCVYVEDQSPTMWKVHDERAILDYSEQFITEENPEGEFHWMTQNMAIDLYCQDEGDHPVNHVKVWYSIWDDISETWTQWSYSEGELAHARIFFAEDSVHMLKYYCEDALGNSIGTRENPHLQYYKVDTAEPIISRSLEGPSFGNCEVGHPDNQCWIKDWYYEDGTTITIDAQENPELVCSVDEVACDWWYLLDGILKRGEYGITTPFDIKFYEDTEHQIFVECKDALGNTAYYNETFYVDSLGPVVEKTFNGPQKILDYGEFKIEWINGVTTISLEAFDRPEDSVCAVGNAPGAENTIYYIDNYFPDEEDWRYCYDPYNYCRPFQYENPDWQVYNGVPLPSGEESCHVLEFFAVDELGNVGERKVNCYFVDKTAPTITKMHPEGSIEDSGEPAFMNEGNPSGDFTWLTQNMPITFTCRDEGDHPSGDEEFCFKVSYDYAEIGGYPETAEYGWGYITEQYCSEAAGEMNDEGYCCMDMSDYYPRIAQESIVIPPGRMYEFYFMEDSMHNLEYYCQDAVKKSSGVHVQYYKVDTQGPVSEHTFTGPYYTNSETGFRFIDNATRIIITNEDGGEICAVDGTTTYYAYAILRNEACENPDEYCMPVKTEDWMTYEEGGFGIPEESCHVIQYFSVDQLNNQEASVKYDCVFVDHTPPQIIKEYDEKHYYESQGVEWISLLTEIFISANDEAGPHVSGLKSLEYRMTQMETEDGCWMQDDYYCQDAEGTGEWIAIEPETTIWATQESCHLIEIRAVDNVDKETVHKQCVFVDNTEPQTNKIIGLPRYPMSDDNKVFGTAYYPELDPQGENICAESADKCWDVTMWTPINLDCEDIEPHPSGAVDVCFKVTWDAVDVTEQYCSDEGTMKEGYCCIEDLETTFYFKEETWHTLEYYCIDNVGNSGGTDIEYFKVGDTPFTIKLNKKWNLISVPLKLTDESMDAIFEPIADKVVSIWQFDGFNWHVYSPDGNPSNDDITTMHPGWGYWIFTTDEAMLSISGDWIEPSITPPSVPIVHGWNLIGYFGTDGKEGYYGPISQNSPVGTTRPAYCSLASLRTSTWDTNAAYLSTWWEPYNPNQLVELNPGNLMHPGDWMDAGAGYWLFYTEPSGAIYTRSSTCPNYEGPMPGPIVIV